MTRERTQGNRFLSRVDSAEREVAKILTMITGVIIAAALVQLIISLGLKLFNWSETSWLGDDLIKLLGDLLTVLIALEVLQNITSYLRRHVVQIELVLITAMTAVARKVIVLPTAAVNKPQLLIGLGTAVISLSAAYWLIKRSTPWKVNSSTTQSRQSLVADLSVQSDDDDERGERDDPQH